MVDKTEPTFGKQLPAASTFAGSADSIFEALAFFLGEPAVPEKLKVCRFHTPPPPPTHPLAACHA